MITLAWFAQLLKFAAVLFGLSAGFIVIFFWWLPLRNEKALKRDEDIRLKERDLLRERLFASGRLPSEVEYDVFGEENYGE